MARKGSINRDQKRQEMYLKYRSKRADLKRRMKEAQGDPVEVIRIQMQLTKLPWNSSPTRLKNRCKVTGRPRGYIRKFGLSRITFREFAHKGFLPGVTKSSW